MPDFVAVKGLVEQHVVSYRCSGASLVQALCIRRPLLHSCKFFLAKMYINHVHHEPHLVAASVTLSSLWSLCTIKLFCSYFLVKNDLNLCMTCGRLCVISIIVDQ